MRADRVALVLGEVELRHALAGKDVEVIEPEVGHHFLELAIAERGAQDLLFGQLLDDLSLLSLRLHLGRRSLGLRAVIAGCVVTGRRVLLRLDTRAHGRDEIVVGDLTRALGQRREPVQASVHQRIGDPFGVQLLIDVALETHLAHPGDIAGSGAETDSIQHMEDGLVIRMGGNRRR